MNCKCENKIQKEKTPKNNCFLVAQYLILNLKIENNCQTLLHAMGPTNCGFKSKILFSRTAIKYAIEF